ncbi:endolytic transglycosylase MltG [Peribacillus loiseleuriae]|uniref:Aminodeoxychorismate lyase n=1 Tax=Peribacillus loiseleuriae TaxID=1679170 RepID=A0A0K9GVZ0_9BACI|nr:endolytic transglycosylase MltG [Peribacillus loiseleuriae]KMY50801.1 hypothetical protein AC625_15810 [Peribacillus loiseleuriae]
MNKSTIRAFAAGIIFTSTLVGCYLFAFSIEKKTTITLEEAKVIVKQNGYIIQSAETSKKEIASESQGNESITDIKKPVTPKQAEKPSSVSYTLIVKSGMTPEKIAEVLENEGIFENGVVFLQYLKENQLIKRIQIGQYTLTPDMELTEIVKMITE